MIRPKGGRAAPRYYYYKQAAENKLVKLLEDPPESRHKPKQKRMSKVDEFCYRMSVSAQLVDNLIQSVRKGLEELKKIRENAGRT
jgi:hypothetical protein